MPARDGLEEEEGVCEEALLAAQRVAIETEHVPARLARVLLPYIVVAMPMMRAALFFFEFLDDGAYGLRAPENKLLHTREERGVYEVSNESPLVSWYPIGYRVISQQFVNLLRALQQHAYRAPAAAQQCGAGR